MRKFVNTGGCLICEKHGHHHPLQNFYFDSGVMKGMRVDVQAVAVVIYFFLKNYKPRDAYDHLRGRISNKSVYNLYKRMYTRVMGRQIINQMATILGGGVVEADETWIRSGNKYHRGRYRTKRHSMVFGLWSRTQKLLYAWPIPNRLTATLRPFFQGYVVGGNRVNTDGYRGYLFLGREGW